MKTFIVCACVVVHVERRQRHEEALAAQGVKKKVHLCTNSVNDLPNILAELQEAEASTTYSGQLSW